MRPGVRYTSQAFTGTSQTSFQQNKTFWDKRDLQMCSHKREMWRNPEIVLKYDTSQIYLSETVPSPGLDLGTILIVPFQNLGKETKPGKETRICPLQSKERVKIRSFASVRWTRDLDDLDTKIKATGLYFPPNVFFSL